ncbi:hypothetical protein Tco_0759404 [Tanacetum coccineum]
MVESLDEQQHQQKLQDAALVLIKDQVQIPMGNLRITLEKIQPDVIFKQITPFILDLLTYQDFDESKGHCLTLKNHARHNGRAHITMEEYIRLEEEKAHRRGKVYNWETATYGKIWDYEDIHDLGSVKTECPTIVFNDTLTSEATLSCEPTVSSLNDDKIDFRVSFDDSDDEDYTPPVSYFDDLDFFKDFENEFPAIVYNDALTSKSDLL